MFGWWPLKKIKADTETSPSRKKMKSPPPKKTRDRPYLESVTARLMYRHKASVGCATFTSGAVGTST
jgi:hypothetical protein